MKNRGSPRNAAPGQRRSRRARDTANGTPQSARTNSPISQKQQRRVALPRDNINTQAPPMLNEVHETATAPSPIVIADNTSSSPIQQQLHPMRGASWAQILPFLSYFMPRSRDLAIEEPDMELQGTSNYRTGVQHEDVVEFNKSEDIQKHLGIGIYSYQRQLVQFFYLFAVLLLLHVPVMLMYNRYDYFDGSDSESEIVQHMLGLSMGNMGFSEPHCFVQPASQSLLSMSCPTGFISAVTDAGVTTMFEDQQMCKSGKSTNYCSQYWKNSEFFEVAKKRCIGEKKCTVPNVKDYVSSDADGSICTSDESRFYVQYRCQEQAEILFEKKTSAFIVSVLVGIGAFLTMALFTVNWMRTKRLEVIFDETNLTASDYTIHLEITDVHREEFEKMFVRELGQEKQEMPSSTELQPSGPPSAGSVAPRGILFKRYIERKLEANGVRIARIDLAFDQSKMIDVLELRGQAIKEQNVDRVAEIEKEIETVKREMYDAKVVAAFVTYQSESDLEVIRNTFAVVVGREQSTIQSKLGQSISDFRVHRPQEPSDINWKNLPLTKCGRGCRFLFSLALFFATIAFTYSAQDYLFEWKTSYTTDYEHMPCSSKYSRSHLQSDAFTTWKQSTQDNSMANGTLACFCRQEVKHLGWFATLVKEYEYKGSDARFENADDARICQNYLIARAIDGNFAFVQASLIFAPFNQLFLGSGEWLASFAGFAYKSNERIYTNFMLFLCLLCNSFLIPVLVAADFSKDYRGSLVDRMLSQGYLTDFNAQWFKDLGPQLSASMLVLALQPVQTMIGEAISLKFTRFFKLRFTYSGQINNNNDNMKYLELYAGPEYSLQSRPAPINVVIFMTIVMGQAFPLFYCVALLSIAMQYVFERISLAMFYRVPVRQGVEITLSNIRLLNMAPLLGLAVSLWQMGNPFMFNIDSQAPMPAWDRVNEKRLQSFHTPAAFGRRLVSLELQPAEYVLAIVFIAMFIFSIATAFSSFLSLFAERVSNMTGQPVVADMQFQTRKVPDYYKSLSQTDLEQMVEEEQMFVHDFRVQNISASSLQIAEDTLAMHEDPYTQQNKSAKKQQKIIGEPYYQVYKNFDYWLKFNTQNTQEERMIKLLLCMPLVPKHVHQNIRLNSSERLRRQIAKAQQALQFPPNGLASKIAHEELK